MAVGFQVTLGTLVQMLPLAILAAIVVAVVRFLSVTAAAYAVSGPLTWVWNRIRRKGAVA